VAEVQLILNFSNEKQSFKKSLNVKKSGLINLLWETQVHVKVWP